MKRLLTTSVLALGALVAAADTSAQTRFGLGAGFEFDDDAPFVSAQMRTSRGVSIPLRFNPHVDFLFPGDDKTKFQVGLNGLYDFGVSNVSFTPYAGVGLAIGYAKEPGRNGDDPDIEPGANFLFGAEFNTATARPYLQLQVSTTRAMGASISGGILF